MLQYKSNLKKLLIASILFPALTGCHDFSDLTHHWNSDRILKA